MLCLKNSYRKMEEDEKAFIGSRLLPNKFRFFSAVVSLTIVLKRLEKNSQLYQMVVNIVHPLGNQYTSLIHTPSITFPKLSSYIIPLTYIRCRHCLNRMTLSLGKFVMSCSFYKVTILLLLNTTGLLKSVV